MNQKQRKEEMDLVMSTIDSDPQAKEVLRTVLEDLPKTLKEIKRSL